MRGNVEHDKNSKQRRNTTTTTTTTTTTIKKKLTSSEVTCIGKPYFCTRVKLSGG